MGRIMARRDRGVAPTRLPPGPLRDRREILKRVPKLRKIKPAPPPKG